jgi:DNA invertase Pin-like site-specific DNA recombinase
LGAGGRVRRGGEWKYNDRKQLVAALDASRKHKAKLVIANLGRLSRDLAFIATLMESGVEFVAVGNPHANKLTVHILAAVAQHEREMISERTRAALQAAKARQSPASRRFGAGRRRSHGRRRQVAANVLPLIREIQASGITSANAIAGKLNDRGVRTARGGKWTHVQVGAALARA